MATDTPNPGEARILARNGAHEDIPSRMRHADIAMLVGAMKLFAWLNLVQGLLNILFYALLPAAPHYLAMTGMLSVVMFGLVYLKIYYMMHTRNWVQISLTAVCGLYVPVIALLVSSIGLADALL